jgi:hypothetical protein
MYCFKANSWVGDVNDSWFPVFLFYMRFKSVSAAAQQSQHVELAPRSKRVLGEGSAFGVMLLVDAVELMTPLPPRPPATSPLVVWNPPLPPEPATPDAPPFAAPTLNPAP